MLLFFIRHGQTDYNAERRFQGRLDIPLNETGRQQAHKIKTLLANENTVFDVIYSSPLSRAMETAEIISLDIAQPIIESRLIEVDLGDFDGRLETEIAGKMGNAAYLEWRQYNFTVPAPNGESIGEAMNRVKPFLTGLHRLPAAEAVGIIAHQGILMAAKAVISGESSQQALNEFKQANDEIDIWSLSKRGRISVLRLSD